MGTKIEWTEETWNPVTGCSKVSPGCEHCYAERISLQRGWSKKVWAAPNAAENVIIHPSRLEQPLRWQRPRMIFVNSMSDLLHEQLTLDYILSVFAVMEKAHRHTFQVLTKRSMRLYELDSALEERGGWPPNVWMGVSVEDQRRATRIDELWVTGAAVKFVSAEPLLGPLDISDLLPELDWVICGGESGPNCRPMELGWARQIRDDCIAAQVPFFLKQLGGHPDKRGGEKAILDGRTWQLMPSPSNRDTSPPSLLT